MAHTISLLNMKGGVGKTTLAVNLGWYVFRHRKKRVLLVDFDPQFNASQYLMKYDQYEKHVREKGTVADLLIESPTLRLRSRRRKPAVETCIARLKSSPVAVLDFLPAQLALAHVVKNPAQMEFKLEKILSAVREGYDFVFIDCAPTDSVLTTMALTASGFVLVPMRPDRFSILGFANLNKTIDAFRENSSDPNKVQNLGVVFTQVRGKSNVESACMSDIRKEATRAQSYVFASMLQHSDTFIRAIQNQTPAFATKYARNELKSNIRDIVAEMEARMLSLGCATNSEGVL